MNSFGKNFRVTSFGESHGVALGVVIDGCLPKIELNEKDIQIELERRKPGQNEITTPRQESDQVQILSGIFEGKTTGMPICALVFNTDHRSQDYKNLQNFFRPGHADETYQNKYGIRDYRGGGRASGRETVGRVIAGAIAKKVLNKIEPNLKVLAYTKQVGDIQVNSVDFDVIEKNPFRAPNLEIVKIWSELLEKARKEKDSLGGVVEIVVQNTLPNLGSPVFDKLEADFAKALMSIGAVKGFEIGTGFDASLLKGSEMNQIEEGIYGGISNGKNLVMRIAVKPTPSIGQKQKNKSGEEIEIQGRHDPIILPRLVPVAEAMVNLVILDHFLENLKYQNK